MIKGVVEQMTNEISISNSIHDFVLVYIDGKLDLWNNTDLLKSIESEKPSKTTLEKINIPFPKFNEIKNDNPIINELYNAIVENNPDGSDSFGIMKDLMNNLVEYGNKGLSDSAVDSTTIINHYIKKDIPVKTKTTSIEATTNMIQDNYTDAIRKINAGESQTIIFDCEILDKYKNEDGKSLYDLLKADKDNFVQLIGIGLNNCDCSDVNYIKFKDENLEPIEMKNTLASNIGKFFKTKGVVKGVYEITPQFKTAVYECRGCMRVHEIEQIGNTKPIEPSMCDECGGRSFRLLQTESEFINTRQILLEEPIEEISNNGTPIQRQIISIGDNKYMRKLTTGSRAEITGILRTYLNQDTGKYQFYIEETYIEKIGDVEMEITDSDMEAIKELSKKKDILNLLIESTAPQLKFNDSEIKECVLCCIVGGGEVTTNDRTLIHMIIISDPGTAKTDLFDWILDNIIEKGTKTSGSSASGVGLTGAVVRDNIIGQYVLKAGALPLASGGVCIGDELDKLGKEQLKKLNNMLERGYEDFNKGGLNERLYAYTTFIGGANPKFERFDEYKSLSEQIPFNPSFLSRMDFIIIMKDDITNDRMVLKKIYNRFTGSSTNSDNESSEIIDSLLLKKYLHYAKSLKPVLTQEAMDKAIEYSIDIRKKLSGYEARNLINFDYRDASSLARVGGAIAKLHLRNEITVSDMEEAIRLKNYCLEQMGYNYYSGEFVIEAIDGKTTNAQIENENAIIEIIEAEKQDYKLKGIIDNFIGVKKQDIIMRFKELTDKSESTAGNTIKRMYENNLLKKEKLGRETYYNIFEQQQQ